MVPAVPGGLDRWSDPAALAADPARSQILQLETRAKTPDEITIRAAYLDLLGIRPGDVVLDVGCGSGVVARELAKRVGPRGRTVGVDPSPVFLEVGRELAEQTGPSGSLELRLGDARSLPCADGEFDAVVAATVLTHIPDGERAIPEMARVTKPGGRVGVFDRDLDSLIIGHPDRTLTQRIILAFADHGAANAKLTRRLPDLLGAAGLEQVQLRAFTMLDRDPDGFFATTAEYRAEVAALAGAITSEERDRWLAQFRQEREAGRFLAGLTYFFAWGRRR